MFHVLGRTTENTSTWPRIMISTRPLDSASFSHCSRLFQVHHPLTHQSHHSLPTPPQHFNNSSAHTFAGLVPATTFTNSIAHFANVVRGILGRPRHYVHIFRAPSPSCSCIDVLHSSVQSMQALQLAKPPLSPLRTCHDATSAVIFFTIEARNENAWHVPSTFLSPLTSPITHKNKHRNTPPANRPRSISPNYLLYHRKQQPSYRLPHKSSITMFTTALQG